MAGSKKAIIEKYPGKRGRAIAEKHVAKEAQKKKDKKQG